MEKIPEPLNGKEQQTEMDLPPGFRFHPTDEELITHYLTPKVLDNSFCARAIGEVDLNKCEPWDLPWKAKMGEKEWYFFCRRDRKYPTGLRTNRATDSGYWKATGKDKEIFRKKTLVGMKKTLVFYKGRAPRGQKSDWVLHEYRLLLVHEKSSAYNNILLPKTPPEPKQNEWVICRIFHKSSGGKKLPMSGLVRRMESYAATDEVRPPPMLPPLMDSSPYNGNSDTGTATGEASHVTCFSDRMEDQKAEEDVSNSFNTRLIDTNTETYLEHRDSGLVQEQDQSLLRILLGNDEPNMKKSMGTELSHDSWHWQGMDMSFMGSNQELMRKYFEDSTPLCTGAIGQQDLDFLWEY